MTTLTIMLDELCAPVIEMLMFHYIGRILDFHMGIYELEEGEIIDYDVTMNDFRTIAECIVISMNFDEDFD